MYHAKRGDFSELLIWSVKTAKILKLNKDFYSQSLFSVAAFTWGVTANNHHVSFFIDATRPEGRQPEAKRWKWGLDQSYKQTFQIKGLLQQQEMVLHITSNSSGPWYGSHWKCGKILRRLSFSDILPNTLLPVCFFVSRSLFLLKCSCWEDKTTEKSCLQPQHNKESIQGQIRLRYLTSKP